MLSNNYFINNQNYIIHQFNKLDSTNDYAMKQALANNLFHNEIIIAKEQSAGKGRNLRHWHSPEGNLYFSLILQPKIPTHLIPQISFIAITALRMAIEKISPTNLIIENKWPNDLLINQKKVAGLLLESKIIEKNHHLVIVGIGVNINSNPTNTLFPASNLKNFNIEILATNLLKKFLDEFSLLYQNWLDFGFANIRKLWLSKAFNFNKEILVSDNEKKISGIFENIDEEGNLMLLTTQGQKKFFAVDLL